MVEGGLCRRPVLRFPQRPDPGEKVSRVLGDIDRHGPVSAKLPRIVTAYGGGRIDCSHDFAGLGFVGAAINPLPDPTSQEAPAQPVGKEGHGRIGATAAETDFSALVLRRGEERRVRKDDAEMGVATPRLVQPRHEKPETFARRGAVEGFVQPEQPPAIAALGVTDFLRICRVARPTGGIPRGALLARRLAIGLVLALGCEGDPAAGAGHKARPFAADRLCLVKRDEVGTRHAATMSRRRAPTCTA